MSINISADKIMSGVFDNLKKCTPALVSVLLGTAFLLFAPEAWLQRIHLNNLSNTANVIIGASFFLSAILVIVIASFKISREVSRWWATKKREKNLPKLSEAEKKIIKIMYYVPGHLLSMPIEDGFSGVLRAKGIVSMASDVSDGIGLLTFKHVLQPWVVKYLDTHPDFYPISEEQIKIDYQEYMERIRF